MPQNARIAVIILNYNGGEALLRAVQSVLAGSIVPRLYVVDNASTDGSGEHALRHFPNIIYLRNGENVGFAAGMNVGLRQALTDGAEYYWLLNDDTEVRESALEELLVAAERFPQAGLLSPAIYELDGITPWFLGGSISYFRMRTSHSKKIYPKREGIIASEFLTGCALFFSRAVIETCGFLDEHYFLYYEDAAYCVRARQRGFSPALVLSARVRHAERRRASEEQVYWLVRSGIRFFRTMSPWYWQPWISLYLGLRKAKNAIELLLSPSPIAQAVRRAYTDASRETYA